MTNFITDILASGGFLTIFSGVLIMLTISLCCMVVVKIIVIVGDSIHTEAKSNHNAAMAAESKNLAVDLNTNDIVKTLVTELQEIKIATENNSLKINKVLTSLEALKSNNND